MNGQRTPRGTAGRGRPRTAWRPRAAPVLRMWRRSLRWWRRAPRALRAVTALTVLAALALLVNLLYQVLRKPSELFFPVSGVLLKTPEQTWHDYSAAFRRYATADVSPQLLAALAQVEAAGNPLAHTYWRWAWADRPFDLYRPASSAVGMYQITDGNFEEARHYCIRDHRLVREGPWSDWHGCWFNGAYLRVVPADAVQLTAAYLELKVSGIRARLPPRPLSARERQHLAALVHLCGAATAAAFAQRGFRLLAGQRCGEQDPRIYLQRVDAMAELFARLDAHEQHAQ